MEPKMTKKLEPLSPGEILKEEYLDPLHISQNHLAEELGVPPGRINEIVRGRRSITADTALRLAKYFETTPEFWLNLQHEYDLRKAKSALGNILKTITVCKNLQMNY